jgi:hypothetical protein
MPFCRKDENKENINLFDADPIPFTMTGFGGGRRNHPKNHSVKNKFLSNISRKLIANG